MDFGSFDFSTFDLNALIATVRSIIEGLIAEIRNLVSSIRDNNESGTPAA